MSVWISFAMLLAKLVMEYGPDLWEWLQRIFSRWKQMPERSLKGEVRRFNDAAREKLLAKVVPSMAPGCPLEAYCLDLEARVPASAAV